MSMAPLRSMALPPLPHLIATQVTIHRGHQQLNTQVAPPPTPLVAPLSTSLVPPAHTPLVAQPPTLQLLNP